MRIRSNLVVVPALVYDKARITGPESPAYKRCAEANARTFYSLPPSKAYVPRSCSGSKIHGLTAKNFRIFQGGVEQKIQSVTFGRWRMSVRDNMGKHVEYSETPRGIWSTADLPAVFSPSSADLFYNIAYAPIEPRGGKGCHKIVVKVNVRNAFVVLPRGRFCNGQSPSDPLNGTWLDGQMLRDLTSGKRRKLGISLQAGWTRGHGPGGRVYVALRFRWYSIAYQWIAGGLHGTLGVLGLVQRGKAGEAARFSDLGCCLQHFPKFYKGYNWGSPAPPPISRVPHRMSVVPTRYETQLNLSPGRYQLRVVLSDGEKFGRAEATLDIPTRGIACSWLAIWACAACAVVATASP